MNAIKQHAGARHLLILHHKAIVVDSTSEAQLFDGFEDTHHVQRSLLDDGALGAAEGVEGLPQLLCACTTQIHTQ